MFDPAGLRPFVTDWEEVAESLVRRAHREAVGGVPDEATSRLLDEVLAFPGVPEPARRSTVPTCPETARRGSRMTKAAI